MFITVTVTINIIIIIIIIIIVIIMITIMIVGGARAHSAGRWEPARETLARVPLQ